MSHPNDLYSLDLRAMIWHVCTGNLLFSSPVLTHQCRPVTENKHRTNLSCLLVSYPEQSGVMVVPHPAVRDDHLLRHDPGVLRGGRVQRQDGGAALRPLRHRGPAAQRRPAGQLLDAPAHRPAALHEQAAPAGQHRARAVRRGAGQRRLLPHV